MNVGRTIQQLHYELKIFPCTKISSKIEFSVRQGADADISHK